MKRRLLNVLTALSLLLFAAAAALWVRSYWRNDTFVFATATGEAAIRSSGGQFGLSWMPRRFSPPDISGWLSSPHDPHRASWSAMWKFEAGSMEAGGKGHRWRAVVFPHWCLTAAAALAPAWRGLASLSKRRRKRSGLCPQCGYDLRATPDRCPECGHMPAGVTA